DSGVADRGIENFAAAVDASCRWTRYRHQSRGNWGLVHAETRGRGERQRMTVIVLFGGRSDERHVSVASAQNVVRTLGAPLAWFWAPDGPVHDVSVDDLLSHQRPFEIDFQPRRPAIWQNIEQALDTLPVEDPVFVLALHGCA